MASMDDSSRKHHWKSLAESLGAAPAAEPPVEAASADAAGPTVPVTPPARPKAPQFTARPGSQPRQPKSNWGSVARELGLEVSEPEPATPPPADLVPPVAPAVAAVPATEPARARRLEPEARESRPEVFGLPPEPETSWREPVGEVSYNELDDELVAAEPARRGWEEPAEPVESIGDEERAGVAGAKEEPDESREEPRRRRRRRRGRRGRRPESEGATDQESGEETERHALAAAELFDAHEDEVEEVEREASEVTATRPTRRSEVELDEDEEELEGDDDDVGRPKHTKIPSWEQAIGALVDANLAARSRAPSGPRGRGRGPRR